MAGKGGRIAVMITFTSGDKLMSLNEILENVRAAVNRGDIHGKGLEVTLVQILAIALGESTEFITNALKR
jgi:hypothetical protein